MADLPLHLDAGLSARLAAVLDIEGKIPRAFEALGPLAGRDVVLVDAAEGRIARRIVGQAMRLVLLERADRVDALRAAAADLGDAVRVETGEASATGLPTASADVLLSCWSSFREHAAEEVAEARRVLRPGGRLLVLHDYGRDDVATLRDPDLPEYGSWSRRDGWFIRFGFKVRVIHCWWTFEDGESAAAFLEAGFGARGEPLVAALRRPRLSYNVAIYHWSRPGER